MIEINVKLFSAAKDVAGISEMMISLDQHATASHVLDYLVHTNPRFAEWRNHVRVAVNWEYVEPDRTLHDGDEVAIIPPVSGG